MPRPVGVLLVAVLLLVPAARAAGQDLRAPTPPKATLTGVSMARSIEVADHALVLNGMALRKKAFIKVYVAGLYLLRKNSDALEILDADDPRVVVMEFLRGVSAGQLCDAWNDDREANTPKASASLLARYETLCAAMEDVEKGDRLTFTYLPRKGTEIRVRGAVKGTVPGKDFADALFRSWIGPRPGPGNDFKRALLGAARPG